MLLGTVAGAASLLGGCLTSSSSDSPEDATPACSNAELTDVELQASTSGDVLLVRGTVSDLPAPSLEGYVVHVDGEKERTTVEESLDSTGSFTRRYEYGHHGVHEYDFWLAGCDTPEPTE